MPEQSWWCGTGRRRRLFAALVLAAYSSIHNPHWRRGQSSSADTGRRKRRHARGRAVRRARPARPDHGADPGRPARCSCPSGARSSTTSREARHRPAAGRRHAGDLGRRQDRDHQCAPGQVRHGTTMDAAAVKTSLDRDLTLPTSARKSDLTGRERLGLLGPSTAGLDLTRVRALVAQLADRAGMVMSPAALSPRAPLRRPPVCVGPFSSRAGSRRTTSTRRSRTRTTTTPATSTWTGVVQIIAELDHAVHTALRRRAGARRGRVDRRRCAAGRLQPPAADLGVARLPGHHRQPRQRHGVGSRPARCRPVGSAMATDPRCGRRSS